jgi:hypothetical protein
MESNEVKPKAQPILSDGFSKITNNEDNNGDDNSDLLIEEENNNNNNNNNNNIKTVVKTIPKKEILRNKRVDSLLIKYRAKDAHKTFDSLYRLYKTNPIDFFTIKKRNFKDKTRRRIFRIMCKEYKNEQ